MIRINEHYLKLQASYLFSDIARRITAFQKNNPDREIIRLGIGDVTRALPEACLQAFHAAVDEMGADHTFKGYGPEQGYSFLREQIAEVDFQKRGADIAADDCVRVGWCAFPFQIQGKVYLLRYHPPGDVAKGAGRLPK